MQSRAKGIADHILPLGDWFSPFWAAAPKGRCPVGHRGEFPDVRPSVRPSFRTSPPRWPFWPQISPLRPDFGLLIPQISPPRPQSSPNSLKSSSPDLKSGLQALNLPSRPQISSTGFKSALKAPILPLRPKICSSGLKSALQTSNPPSMTSVLGLIFSPSGRLEIHPCVLQDIGPLGPLPCSHSTTSLDHYKQGIGYR